MFPKGMDYIITLTGARRFDPFGPTPRRDSLYTFLSTSEAWLGIARHHWVGVPRIHLVIRSRLLWKAAFEPQGAALPLSYRGMSLECTEYGPFCQLFT